MPRRRRQGFADRCRLKRGRGGGGALDGRYSVVYVFVSCQRRNNHVGHYGNAGPISSVGAKGALFRRDGKQKKKDMNGAAKAHRRNPMKSTDLGVG